MSPAENTEQPIELGLNRPVAPTSPVPAPEQLQFRTIEAENTTARRCAACGSPIVGEYYQISGHDACSTCAEGRKAAQQRKGGAGHFLRATMFGMGAALAGTAIYAIIELALHIQLSLIAILVGVIVGKAVLKGAGGCRGRRYQFLAITLTYFSITSSFIPVVISEIAKKEKAKASVEAPAQTQPKITGGGALVGLAAALTILVGISLASPIIELFSDGFGGILTIVIIGIGLRQAWRLTRPDRVPIVGPLAP